MCASGRAGLCGRRRCRRSCCVWTGMPLGFGRRRVQRGTGIRCADCSQWRRFTRARHVAKRRLLGRWIGRRCATGCIASIPRVQPAWLAARHRGESKLSAAQEGELAALIEAGRDPERDGVVRWRCVDRQKLIQARWGVAYHENSVGRLVKRLGFRHLSVRPRHLGQDPTAIEAFRKVFPTGWVRPPKSSRPTRR